MDSMPRYMNGQELEPQGSVMQCTVLIPGLRNGVAWI